MTLTCRQCGKQFIFSSSEREFYQLKGFSPPNHCRECRALRRASPVLCAKCGQKQDGNAIVFCAACQENVRLELEADMRKLQTVLEELSFKLEAGEREKKQLADVLNAKVAAVESEKIQLSREKEAKIAVVEDEKTQLIDETQKKLNTAGTEKQSLTALLAQEKQTRTDLQDKLNVTRVELEKALKYHATLDYLEPTLLNIRNTLVALGRNQEILNQTLLQWAREAAIPPPNGSLFENIKRILRIGPKSTSPAN